mgnify:FL=1
MSFQTVFQRYELKYLLTQEQKKKILQAMAPYMELDQYGRTTIRNLYFDPGNYRLARHSIEKPSYKEKLRVRSYSQADPESPVFVELKKKYRNVVYKRRIALPEKEAMEWLQGGSCSQDVQISREVDYFLSYYRNLAPVVFLSYEREAFFSEERIYKTSFSKYGTAYQSMIYPGLVQPVYAKATEPGTVREAVCYG